MCPKSGSLYMVEEGFEPIPTLLNTNLVRVIWSNSLKKRFSDVFVLIFLSLTTVYEMMECCLFYYDITVLGTHLDTHLRQGDCLERASSSIEGNGVYENQYLHSSVFVSLFYS